MKAPTNILVPVDFSEFSEYALDYALALAGKLGAKVNLVNVIGIPTMGVPELGMAFGATMIDELVKANQAGLDKLVEPRRTQGTIDQVLLRTGDARDVILQTCEELAIDLIIMGTHGRRGVTRALLGSVAEMIVRTAPCPVLTVRSPKGRK